MKGREVLRGLVGVLGMAALVRAAGELVAFPERFESGVHYAGVNRGNIKEEIFTDAAAVEDRYFACHHSQARHDFVFTSDRMKAAA